MEEFILRNSKMMLEVFSVWVADNITKSLITIFLISDKITLECSMWLEIMKAIEENSIQIVDNKQETL